MQKTLLGITLVKVAKMKTRKDKFLLKETCDIFNVSPSKVLYWEKKGLLNISRSPNNDYRTFSYTDHVALSDILFYKNLGLSLSEIKNLHSMNLDEYSEVLFNAKKRTEEKIKEIMRIQHEIDKKLNIINKLYSLEQSGYQEAELPVNGIIPLYDIEASQYHELLLDLEKFASVINIKQQNSKKYETSYTHGLIVPDYKKYNNILFKKSNTCYIRFLLKVPFESSDSYFDTMETYEHISNIQIKYGLISRIICKYLLTAVSNEDDILYDYFEAYAEIS